MLDAGWSYVRIGKEVGLNASTVAYWAVKHGLESSHRERHLPRGGLPREVLQRRVEAGASTRAIARELGVSQSTVKHWLRRYGLRTVQARTREERRRAGRKHPTTTMTCVHHGVTEFTLEGRGSYRCCRCRSEAVAKRRRKMKEILVCEAGGRCAACGYDGCIAALHFHHLDPEIKEFSLAARGVTRSLEAARAEMEKCVLLCSNCHAEVEAGWRSL